MSSSWKCSTKEQNYWDTPYERSMGPTSNRDKVTVKGIVVDYDAAKGGDIRITTSQGAFSFPMDASLWTAPRQFLNGRVEVRAAPQTTILAPGPKAADEMLARRGHLWRTP